MHLSERRKGRKLETSVPINKGAALVTDQLMALEDRLNQIEGFVGERPDSFR